MAQEEGVFTNIDAFVKYLNDHGESESSAIAASLGVSERNVEEWAKILERSKMAKIVYKLGKMYIAPAEGQGAVTEEQRQLGEVKKAIVSDEIDSQKSDVEKLKLRIEELNKAVGSGDAVLKAKAGDIKEILGRIDKLQKQAGEAFGQIKGKKAQFEKFMQELQDMTGTLTGEASLSNTIVQNRNNANAAIEDLRAKIHTFEHGADDMLRIYDNAVKDERAKLVEFSNTRKNEMNALNALLKEEQENLKKYDMTIKDYKNNSARIRQELEKNKTDAMDSVSKIKASMDGIYASAQTESGRLDGILAAARDGLTGFEEMNKRLEGIKQSVDDAEKQVRDIESHIDSLSQKLRSVDSMGKLNVKEREETIGSVDEGVKATSGEIGDASAKLESVKKDVDDLSSG